MAKDEKIEKHIRPEHKPGGKAKDEEKKDCCGGCNGKNCCSEE